MASWRELAPGNYLLATPGALLNTGLIVGSERALVIDTGCGPRQGAQILQAVREVTPLPLVVVNTHAHYDHFFGNAVFAADGATEFWAHQNAAKTMAEKGEAQRRQLNADFEPEMASAEGENTELVLPNALVKDQPVLVDLGGLSVTLFYLGRGHTDGDLLVGSPSVVFAGDLVEEGAHPSFEDSYPMDWADTLRQLSALRQRYEFLAPGHGRPVNDEFVKTMATTMSTAVRMAQEAMRETPNDATKSIPILPYGPEQSRWFIARLKQVS
ncbi:glyoxylase-like metal-dependent hydrolase (beta-lactamase superfamily II) [Psychromicrobium silvestre]|uniref:Glyoxylase-like metal-dependent hydrolase (Beta-lactamase superfamily II) n=1 Tax=Psychromicrobium silvestre TaxID=1645614 RepID=A0A7Y9S800_9MICC|nr:MBL fold metallo-hydrolase [Psychromicrobium silvestre]NYE95496.1 glyoxylase-like metal-dependent hydrolase (beta-lactamase superfamily II) [Psychromicrobium silvestre]